MNFKFLLKPLLIPILICHSTFSLGADLGSGESAQPEIKNYGYNYLEENTVSQNVSTYTTDLLGDKIDPGTGTIAIEQVDIDILGNFNIPVRIKRKLSGPDGWYRETRDFENWSLDIPHVRSTYLTNDEGNFFSSYWPNGNACSARLNSNPTFSKSGVGGVTYYGHSASYWNGDTIYIPEKGSAKLTEKENDDTFTRYNNRNWKVDCISTDNGYEGFKVTTGDGTEYYFKQQKVLEGIKPFNLSPAANTQVCDGVYVLCPPLTISLPEDSPVQYPQYFIFMLATEVKDRFGNWVKYNYENDGSLTSITSSDGREINISYTNNRISSISADGETWLYTYNNASGGIIATLEKVTRPDNLFWLFEYDEDSYNSLWRYMNIAHHSQLNTGGNDQCVANGIEVEFLSITHPEGATGSFKLRERCLNKSNVSKIVRPNPNRWPGERYWIPLGSNLWTLDSKNLSVPGGEDYLWEYNYTSRVGQYRGDEFSSANRFSFDVDGVETGNMNYTEIVNPDNSKLRYYYSRKVGNGSNNLLFKEVYDVDGALLQRDEMHYEDGIYHGTSKQYTHISASPNDWTLDDVTVDHSSSQQQNLTETKTTLFSGNTASTYTTQYDDFNIYDTAKLTTEFNSFSAKRKEVRKSYDHDLTQWIINQPTTIEVKNDDGVWEVIHEQTYYNKTHSNYPFYPYAKKSFGDWVIKNTAFTNEGNVSNVNFNTKLSDNTTYRYQRFSDYHRGQPQSISTSNRYNVAGTEIITRVIDNNGHVIKTTDSNGNVISYGYDDLGRLAYIDLADSQLADTLFTWSFTSGVSSNQPMRTIKRCVLNAAKTTCSKDHVSTETTVYDGLFRPLLITIKDEVSKATTYQNNQFDLYGKPIFQSFPSTSSAETDGLTTVYDALQRVKLKSLTGNGITSTEYLSNNNIKVTDAEGNETTTTYLAYGSPSYNKPKLINSPENLQTTFVYNAFDKITSITQSGGGISHTEYRAYDAAQKLCKVSRDDVGVAAYSFSIVGELQWKAEGISSSGNHTCINNVPSSQKVDYVYDNLGSLWEVNYGDTQTPDVVYTRDGNSNIIQLDSGSVSQSYIYNSLNKPTSETLSVDDKNYQFSYGYDVIGATKSIVYPTSDVGTLSYTNNGLGQTTNITSSYEILANDARYHANGMLKSLVAGNGITYSMTLNSSQLPESLSSYNSSQNVVNLIYDYDDNQNITMITDTVATQNSLSNLSYDGLDRLIATSGSISGLGSSTIQYDALGNIEFYENNNSVAPFSLTYDYTSNRLTNITGLGSTDYNFSLNGSYDARGNIINNGKHQFTYNLANQMVGADGFNYVYDGFNRRVKKDINGEVTYSVYNYKGQLLYQENTSTGKKTSHIYLGSKLIAKVDNDIARPTLTAATTSSNGTISLTWNAVSGTTNYELEVKNSNGNWNAIYSGSATSYAVTGYSNGDYEFRLRACMGSNCSGYSNAKVTVLNSPSKPSSIIAPSENTNGSYTVSWSNMPTATYYRLRERKNGGDWVTLSYPNGVSQFISGKSNGDYEYSVKACNSSGCSDYSYSPKTIVLLPPAIPTSVTTPSSDADGSYTVSWSSVSTVTYYRLRERKNGADWVTLGYPNGVNQNISGKSNGDYEYSVKACNSSGCSDYKYSSKTVVLLPPLAPSLVSVPSVATSGSFTISWASSSTATKYTLEESVNGGEVVK